MGKEKELQKIKNDPKSVTPERLESLCKKIWFYVEARNQSFNNLSCSIGGELSNTTT